MKKPTGKRTGKLTMNRETIRALAAIELVDVVAAVDDTGRTDCFHQKIVGPSPA
jgi:hypothetical protein